MGRARKQEPISKDYEEFGNKIRELRLRGNLTQGELAKLMGISKTSVVNYETGTRKIPLTLIRKFSKFFNVSLDELLCVSIDDENEIKGDPEYETVVDNNLRDLRIERNISLEEMSEELEIPADVLTGFESGYRNIPLPYLMKFARFFGVSIDSLVGLELGDRKIAVVTNDEAIQERYKKWQSAIGYGGKFTDSEIDEIITFAQYLLYKREKSEE